MVTAALTGIFGALLGVVLGLLVKRRPAPVVDDGRSRELQATTARRLAEGRADKLQVQVDRLRAACLLPAQDSVATAVSKPPADAAARLVRLMGGVTGAVVASADGLSLSAKETPFERSLAAAVSPLTLLSALAPHIGTVGEVVFLLRSGCGVRARVLGDGQMLVIAATGGLPSPLLTRAAFAELNVAAPAKSALTPLAGNFELGAATRIKELAMRAGFPSLALLSGDSNEVAVSAAGLSQESLRDVRKTLQRCALQLSSVFASPVARLEIAADQRLSIVASEHGWWMALHPSLALDDMTVRRLDGAHRISLQTKVA